MYINKENLHEMLPIHMIRKNEEYFSRKRKNSYEEEQNSTSWLKVLESKGKPFSSNRFRQKTIHLVKRMIPHEIRHLVWPSVCQNSLVITE